MSKFVAHGYLILSNHGGLEIEINSDGSQVRLRDSVSQNITEWIDLDEDGTEDGATFTAYDTKYSLGEFIKA